jgi:hypothetical protein
MDTEMEKISDEHCRRFAVPPLLRNPSDSNFPGSMTPWGEVARACRRICVLRERGQQDDAERIRTEELPRLVALARAPEETDAMANERLEKIFSLEEERVASAAVIAELLAPMLAGKSRPAPVEQVAVSVAPMPAAVTPAPAPKPPERRSASIADFIDEMIAQEKPPDRRRAS